MGFAFLDRENIRNFRFIFNRFRSIIKDFGIRPKDDEIIDPIILLDGDNAIIKGAYLELPDARFMRCQWHIYKNINTRIDKVFVGNPDGAAE